MLYNYIILYINNNLIITPGNSDPGCFGPHLKKHLHRHSNYPHRGRLWKRF